MYGRCFYSFDFSSSSRCSLLIVPFMTDVSCFGFARSGRCSWLLLQYLTNVYIVTFARSGRCYLLLLPYLADILVYFVWSGRFSLLLLPDQARCFLLLLPYLADVTGFYFVFCLLFWHYPYKNDLLFTTIFKLFGFDLSIELD